MTWALCFNCGEIKFGAICPCPKCNVKSTGDMNLDIAFSDHNMTKATLEDFGKVVAAIHAQSDDAELCFWTFIRYVSIYHSSILGVDLKPDVAQKTDALLSRISLPVVALTPSQSKIVKDENSKTGTDLPMDWQPHLRNLSRHLLSNLDDEDLDELREHHRVVDYLGRPPAPPELIQRTEARLGFKLPESLISFYQTSDGWQSADGFPVGIASILRVEELFLLSDCRLRELDIYSEYVTQHFDMSPFATATDALENCVVIIDLDGNELGFAVRSIHMDDWPIVTYNPDGGDFESYAGFIHLMTDGLNY